MIEMKTAELTGAALIYLISFMAFCWHLSKDSVARRGWHLLLAWGPFFPLTCITIALIVGWAAVLGAWEWARREC